MVIPFTHLLFITVLNVPSWSVSLQRCYEVWKLPLARALSIKKSGEGAEERVQEGHSSLVQ